MSFSHHEKMKFITLVTFSASKETLPNEKVFSLYFSSALCNKITSSSSKKKTQLEYNRIINNKLFHINVYCVDVKEEQDLGVYEKDCKRGSSFVIFLDIENDNIVSVLDNLMGFLEQFNTKTYILGFQKDKVGVAKEIQNFIKNENNDKYEYLDIKIEDKQQLVKILDKITISSKEEEGEKSEENEEVFYQDNSTSNCLVF